MGKKVATGAVLTALALIFSYIDRQISMSLPLPAVKLGLANCVILVALYQLGTKTAFSVNVLRVCLGNLLFGNPVALAYGLVGGFFSLGLMAILKKTNWFSVVGISIAGATAHIWGQLGVATLLTGTTAVLGLAPFYVTMSLVTGTLLGLLTLRLTPLISL